MYDYNDVSGATEALHLFVFPSNKIIQILCHCLLTKLVYSKLSK